MTEATVEPEAGDGGAEALASPGGRADDVAEFALSRVVTVQVDVPDNLVVQDGRESYEVRGGQVTSRRRNSMR